MVQVVVNPTITRRLLAPPRLIHLKPAAKVLRRPAVQSPYFYGVDDNDHNLESCAVCCVTCQPTIDATPNLLPRCQHTTCGIRCTVAVCRVRSSGHSGRQVNIDKVFQERFHPHELDAHGQHPDGWRPTTRRWPPLGQRLACSISGPWPPPGRLSRSCCFQVGPLPARSQTVN